MFDVINDEEIKILLPVICGKADEKNFKENTCALLSLISCKPAAKTCLNELEYDLAIFNMLLNVCKQRMAAGQTNFIKHPFQRALFNILLNLTNEPKTSNNFFNEEPGNFFFDQKIYRG